MTRLAELDLPDRLAPTVPRWVTQLGFGILCCALAFIVRGVIDLAAPGSAPFALLFPAVALATLFARWQAGAVAAVINVFYAWYFLYPIRNSFAFESPAAALAIFVVAVSCVLLIAIAEIFRAAAYRAAQERDREIAERDLFLAEVEHRVKNNFAVVASLLELQRRRAVEPATQEALGTALTRVQSIARAHRHLYRGNASTGTVDMHDYLVDLCSALADSLFLHGTIKLECSADSAPMPRDRAVSVGLVVNELVTNAVKHAFTGRDRGTIRVTFRNVLTGSRLCVADDGIGIGERKAAPLPDSGLGQRLIDAFAAQAGGTIQVDSDPTGTTVTLELAR